MKNIFAGIIAILLISGTNSFAAGDTKTGKQKTEAKSCTAKCTKEKKDCKDKSDCTKTCKPASCNK